MMDEWDGGVEASMGLVGREWGDKAIRKSVRRKGAKVKKKPTHT